MDNKILLKDFYDYLKKPLPEVTYKGIWYMKLFHIIRLWSLSFFLSLLFVLLSSYFLDRVGYDHDSFALNEFLDDSSSIGLIFAVVLWAPISEELAFRLGLKFSPFRWGLGISMFLLFLILFLDFPPASFFNVESWKGILTILSFLFSITLFFSLLLNVKKVNFFVKEFFYKYFGYFFYSLSLIFAFLHITNYQDNWFELWYLVPLLVMPQFLISLIISYIRIYYGFVWAVFAHALNNGIIAVLLIFFLPVVRLEDSGYSSTEMLEMLSKSELVGILVGFFFFIGVFLLIFISILSLFVEVFSKSKE